jgi:hypothetical protein
MDLFAKQNLLEFSLRFKTNSDCKEYLANFKWGKGFICLQCKHTTSHVHDDFSRTCSLCKHTETASSNTLFQEVKFGLRTAFFICFEMSKTTKFLSASSIGTHFDLTEETIRPFSNKVREAMKSNENYLLEEIVRPDEFVYWWETKR